jgi:BirA family transcriptional regulator, biotin operon repressor / biotin---[acetyl-CoA-carboxylase] ligase
VTVSPPFVRTSIRLDVVESTSDLARQLAIDASHPLPLVVRADRQTRGRGRGDHSWWSDEGSLTFTLLIDPAAHGLRAEHEPRLALATAVAVIEAILEVVPAEGLGIRWPNDVEAGGRKLGGLLPERFETTHGARLAIGIGLNVRTRFDDAPPDVRRLAASLADLATAPLTTEDVERFFRAILERFARNLDLLARDDPGLAARWAHLDALRDRWVRVDLGPRILEGRGCGIDTEGALCLSGEDETHRLFGGQVLREE